MSSKPAPRTTYAAPLDVSSMVPVAYAISIFRRNPSPSASIWLVRLKISSALVTRLLPVRSFIPVSNAKSVAVNLRPGRF